MFYITKNRSASTNETVISRGTKVQMEIQRFVGRSRLSTFDGETSLLYCPVIIKEGCDGNMASAET